MILQAIAALGAWSWVVLGLVLLGLEILVPGTFFLWFGVAAALVGVAALLVDFAWQAQAIAFVVLAVALVLLGRRFFAGAGQRGAQPLLNDRPTRLIGRTYPLAEAIENGTGRVRIDDSVWRVRGPDLPAGTRVRITGHDGAVLTVEPAP
ncbi:NfeD family protein [Prosthecomicrobium pneumaticum]|uniref:NfeD-like C-terminal domain-containing protein n=1 Tax=Prosthecomicrobium pneumaticum TaxID=81895 RepID=A0A7W9FL94_9HYPH|nr:hypothetical protein [Prosthecomicrobium pneumaticum]